MALLAGEGKQVGMVALGAANFGIAAREVTTGEKGANGCGLVLSRRVAGRGVGGGGVLR